MHLSVNIVHLISLSSYLLHGLWTSFIFGVWRAPRVGAASRRAPRVLFRIYDFIFRILIPTIFKLSYNLDSLASPPGLLHLLLLALLHYLSKVLWAPRVNFVFANFHFFPISIYKYLDKKKRELSISKKEESTRLGPQIDEKDDMCAWTCRLRLLEGEASEKGKCKKLGKNVRKNGKEGEQKKKEKWKHAGCCHHLGQGNDVNDVFIHILIIWWGLDFMPWLRLGGPDHFFCGTTGILMCASRRWLDEILKCNF